MKNCIKIFICIMLCLLISGCETSSSQKIKIAVMGNPEAFYPGYKEGIEQAVKDMNAEYADTGYTVECKFYDDKGSYDEGALIVDSIAKDESILAVLASMNMEINQNAAYAFEKANKIFVVPFSLYDGVFENNYKNIFSMCHSGQSVGRILHSAISEVKPGRWAVCVGDGEFEKSEASSFMKYSDDNQIQIVDCVNIVDLNTRFNEIYNRWETLGVDGIVIMQKENQSFDLLKKIKARNPEIVVAGDTSFDNSTLINQNEDIKKLTGGLIMVDEFNISEYTLEMQERIEGLIDSYYEETGNALDTWYFQGYNAARMVGDTAIKNNTLSANEISKQLHENGYKGLLQEFNFSNGGVMLDDNDVFNVYDSNGSPQEYRIEK